MKVWRPVLLFQSSSLSKSDNPADRLVVDMIRLARPNSAQWSWNIPVLIDTGSSDVLLPINIARDLELPLGDLSPAKFANGQIVDAPIVRADLNFNGLQLANIPCGVGPEGVPVLVGMSILRFFDMRVCDGRAQFTLNENAIRRELEAYAKPRTSDEEE